MSDARTPVLIVDDEPASRDALCELLRTEGYAPSTARDGLEALARLARESVALVIADLKMPRMDGLELLREIERRGLPSAVVLLTGRGSIETAVEAMRLGAYDYLTKPVDPQRLLLLIPKVLEAQRTRSALRAFRAPASEPESRVRRMVGVSQAIQEVFDLTERVARSKANVLVVGESGTGKELVARGIHELSPRASQAYISVNSAALPPDLLENELFGHERGAFTGAVIRKQGCFELAHQGTLFLDEVADMSLATQAKLLRVLEGHPYRRLGGTQELAVDVRVIAATNRDIDRMLAEGLFRQDLYFRLSTVEIHLPPLRERGEDVPLLVRAFLAEFGRAYGKPVTKVAPAVMDRMLRHPWPGNVRELRNAVEHAVILASGDTIMLEDLPAGVREPSRSAGRTEGLYLCSIEEMERRLIAEALVRFPTRTRAAEALGVSLRTLYNKIHRYGLAGRDPRPEPAAPAVPPLELVAGRRGVDSLSRSA
jgi:DNA-binding NtrC family response regulator